jgi:hypothetical protein
MDDISNKTLGLFLVIAMAISLGGTLIVLNTTSTGITGYATNTTTGYVNLSVLSAVSITITDAIIDFGVCDLSGRETTYVNSSAPNSSFHNQYCNNTVNWNATNGDWITVRNDGNVNVNLTVKFSYNSTDFFTDPDNPGASWYKYWTENASTTPGCVGSTQTNSLVSVADTEYNACTNLSFAQPNPGIDLYIEANMTSTVTETGNSMTLTFTGYEA